MVWSYPTNWKILKFRIQKFCFIFTFDWKKWGYWTWISNAFYTLMFFKIILLQLYTWKAWRKSREKNSYLNHSKYPAVASRRWVFLYCVQQSCGATEPPVVTSRMEKMKSRQEGGALNTPQLHKSSSTE